MTMSIVGTTGALLGVVSHLQVFIAGEWERYAYKLTVAYASAIPLSIFLVVAIRPSLSILAAFRLASTFWVTYYAGLFTSMSCYRVFFHPLRKFPGPFGAKLSGFWSVKQSVTRFQFHLSVQEAHELYGDFVRIRPREVSINHVDAIRDIHGPGTLCLKGPFYDLNYPARSLQLTRDKAFHSKRRRIWDRGFSTKALSEYEPRVQSHCNHLLSRLVAQEGTPVEIRRWLNFFGFDVMGDLAFGKPFDMLETGGKHFINDQFSGTKLVFGALYCIPWSLVVLKNMPVARSSMKEWMNWCKEQVKERLKMRSDRKDLFSYILGDNHDKSQEISDDLVLDSELAIVAGSDTTSTTLTSLVYLLSCHPEKQKALQAEIDEIFDKTRTFSHQELVGLPMLEGCIHEALRLYPAVASGLQRMTPPQGAKIAGRWIPGDTLVTTPTYTIHRDARHFKHPDSFIPERWFSQPDLIIRKEAFNPFLTGTYSCAGRALAWMEMRMMLAQLVQKFDVAFSEIHHPDGGAGLFEKNGSGYRDFLVAECPPFYVVLSNRQ